MTEHEQIRKILEKLTKIESFLGISDEKPVLTQKSAPRVKNPAVKGVGAGILNLQQEGFLDTPRLVSEIMSRLKQGGYFYRDSVVATKLLRMVKGRDLTRIQEGGKWKYVIRK